MSSAAQRAPRDLFAGTARLATLGEWLKFLEKQYARLEVTLGQVAATAHDEALYLLLRTLKLPLESGANVLKKKLPAAERTAVEAVFRRRLVGRVPAAYLTREAWLGEERFYVDERVIIPRSYFLEIIPEQLDDWLPDPKKVTQVADVCTGSGCLAILLAKHFPKARVDAVDLSPAALEVAAINVKAHRLGRRVTLRQSDVFDEVPPSLGLPPSPRLRRTGRRTESPVKYDVILSNPPYEPSAHCDALAEEFKQEPRLALDGGADGLVIIRKLLRQARTRLTPVGVVLIEVGGLRVAMDREFAALEPHWLHTHDGSNCVCVINATRLKKWKG